MGWSACGMVAKVGWMAGGLVAAGTVGWRDGGMVGWWDGEMMGWWAVSLSVVQLTFAWT